MQLTTILPVLSAFVATSTAYPWLAAGDAAPAVHLAQRQAGDSGLLFDPKAWKPASKTDSRAPCPLLNTIANHGLINHNGKGITDEALMEAFDTWGSTAELAKFVLKLTRGKKLIPTSPWDLADLNVHNAVEQDGSISRLDKYFGDYVSFNQGIFDQFVGNITEMNGGSDEVTFRQFVLAKRARINDSKVNNPEVVYNFPAQTIAGNLNMCSGWGVLGGTPKKSISLAQMKVFFVEERFPTELGWAMEKGWYNNNQLNACMGGEVFIH